MKKPILAQKVKELAEAERIERETINKTLDVICVHLEKLEHKGYALKERARNIKVQE
tara:strand:+ start:933 stop:1103 length:171 start_codon:yes stop_codon:yes gene_type:complete